MVSVSGKTQKPSASASIQIIYIFQLAAALAICVNHFGFALLKGIEIPEFWANEPTLWGIAFLAFSAGILAQRDWNLGNGDRAASGFAITRFIRIAVPTYLAVALDLAFFSEWPPGGTTSWWPLVSVMTLTQTWGYNVFGDSSLPLPLGPSNLIWVGSCLFGLTVIHAFCIRRISSLSAKAAGAMALVFIAVCVLYFSAIHTYEVPLYTWSNENYGELLPPYQFQNWLLLYNPIAEVGHYFTGVALYQWYSRRGFTSGAWAFTLVALVPIAILVISPSTFPKYLAMNIIMVSLIFFLVSKFIWLRSIDLSLVTRYVSPASYEIICLHIMFYDVFPVAATADGFSSILTQVIAVNAGMVILLALVLRILIRPLCRLLQRASGVVASDDFHL